MLEAAGEENNSATKTVVAAVGEDNSAKIRKGIVRIVNQMRKSIIEVVYKRRRKQEEPIPSEECGTCNSSGSS
ncbi:hypothetical protein IEQ34_007513 [Dendrobium chrysotoxum]|uniref:Uncharacterized protein n=1 Tax=Dendrobium chrysotoxum TaxID=161865 RepID=A0AAV7H1H1_DENCH|nr:hypothetical protein IEQ34_007513 [Dendrobium chrysotoxum]